jgi:YD repeat-containing protein
MKKSILYVCLAVLFWQGAAFAAFIDNGNGTITDTGTGLMWQKATAPGTYTWEQALTYCENLTLGGLSDWRLPNRNELQTLVDYSRYNPAIDTTFFSDTVASVFWSSTTYAGSTGYAWYVDFYGGGVGSYNKSYYNYVRAVRGGQCGSFGDSDNNGIPDITENHYGTHNNSGHIAEPVNTALGNYTSEHSDLKIPGRGMSFEFKRGYNSLDPYNGPMGYGWTHSYNIVVNEYTDAVTVKWGDGHQDVYNKQGDGSFIPSLPGIYDTIVKNGDSTWTLARKDQTQCSFDAAGKLTAIVDKNGNTISLSYDGSGYLYTITDTAGRTFTITNDTQGRITQITDPISRTVGYACAA